MKKFSLSPAQWKCAGLLVNLLLTIVCALIFLYGYSVPLHRGAINVSIAGLYLFALGFGERVNLFSFQQDNYSLRHCVFYTFSFLLLFWVIKFIGQSLPPNSFFHYCLTHAWSLLLIIHPIWSIYSWITSSHETIKKEI